MISFFGMSDKILATTRDAAFSFVKGSITGIGISVAVNAFKVKGNITDEKFKENIIKDAKVSIIENAINSVVFNASRAILQEIFNKNDDIKKKLVINAISTALSTLIIDVVVHNDGYCKIAKDVALNAAFSAASTVIGEWDDGGRELFTEYFPTIYEKVINIPFIKSFYKKENELMN
ncbi:hypothetical protein M9Y10_038664 [Tritrichomonas musculus]|uniref:Uncharacterized protein n=1 Tax=Tritrichomonas musculus TaxID=1915356 RepID=A0ABR2KAW3_9EUKA